MLRIRDDTFCLTPAPPEAIHPVETVVLCVRDDVFVVDGDNSCWPFGLTAVLSEDTRPVFV
jgi:hypothetical protein